MHHLFVVLPTLSIAAMMTQSGLTTYEFKYYILQTDLSAKRAAFVGRLMDAAGKEYHRRFQGFRGVVRRKLRLMVFTARERYLSELARASGGKTIVRTRGVFNPGDGIVYTYDGEGLEPTLKHECFHQFVSSVIGGRLPAWTNEGLAEYFAEGVFEEESGRLRLGSVPKWRVGLLQHARETNALMTINALLHLDQQAWNDNLIDRGGALQYTQAWALCHFLVHAEDSRYQPFFEKFLHNVDGGLDADTAFKKAFGSGTEALQEKYDAYLRELRPTGAQLD